MQIAAQNERRHDRDADEIAEHKGHYGGSDIVDVELADQQQQKAEEGRCGHGPDQAGGSQDQQIASLNVGRAQTQVAAGERSDAGIRDRDDEAGGQDGWPGQVAAQHQQFGQHEADEEKHAVVSPMQNDHAQHESEARVPRRDWQTVVLVQKAQPVQPHIRGDECNPEDGVGQQRARRASIVGCAQCPNARYSGDAHAPCHTSRTT